MPHGLGRTVGNLFAVGQYNQTCGQSENGRQIVTHHDKVDALRGLDVTITTSATSDDEARALLKAFNFPIRN